MVAIVASVAPVAAGAAAADAPLLATSPRGAAAADASPRDDLAQHVASCTLIHPSAVEARALVRNYLSDASASGSSLSQSLDGFRTDDAVAASMFDARRRHELFVLVVADGRARRPRWPKLCVQGDRGRRILPAFATVQTGIDFAIDAPYIELLWVHSGARRIGIGSHFVKEAARSAAAVKHVSGVLPEASAFWATRRQARAGDRREASAALPRPVRQALIGGARGPNCRVKLPVCATVWTTALR